MMTLHPHILERDGKKAFAVLPYEEFLTLQEVVTDYEDLKALREAKIKEGHLPTIPFNEAKMLLGV
jgi:hypothetical protein